MRTLPKFIKMQNIITGLFLKPESKDFPYETFGKEGKITEISVLRPNGIPMKELSRLRKICLETLSREDEVDAIHSFKSLWGFENADVLVHFVEFNDWETHQRFKEKESRLGYAAEFRSNIEPLIVSATENIK